MVPNQSTLNMAPPPPPVINAPHQSRRFEKPANWEHDTSKSKSTSASSNNINTNNTNTVLQHQSNLNTMVAAAAASSNASLSSSSYSAASPQLVRSVQPVGAGQVLYYHPQHVLVQQQPQQQLQQAASLLQQHATSSAAVGALSQGMTPFSNMEAPSFPPTAATPSLPHPFQQVSLPHQQPQHRQHPMNTPWTLGSTDGSFAMSLALQMQQEQQQQLLLRQQQEAAAAVVVASSDNAGGAPLAYSSHHHHHQPVSASSPTHMAGAMRTTSAGEPGSADASSAAGSSMASSSGASPDQQYGTLRDGPNADAVLTALSAKQSLYQDRLFRQPSAAVEAVLAASCEVMGFDIAEVWLRTGPKTHQLTNSHLRPAALEDSVRKDLVDVYYGDKSAERTHRLSPALCKRAKEARDVVWVTSQTPHGAEALRCSISNVRTAVAVPVCHEASNTNMTIIFFSIRRIIVRPTAVEYLVHMALAAGIASVNSLADEGHLDRKNESLANHIDSQQQQFLDSSDSSFVVNVSRSEHVPQNRTSNSMSSLALRHRQDRISVTGAQLDLKWRQLHNVEYLTDGGNSWIHTAVLNGKPVVVKTLKPECQDVAVAITEIEGELAVHSRLNHVHIVRLLGAGTTSKGVRFVVLERLDGGTLTQMLGYDTRIRDRRRRFWRKKHCSFLDVLRIARAIAEAMAYCHEDAIPGCIVLHRDLKPDNIGFTLDGTVKIFDFGLAKIVENASVRTEQVYAMSGETGSLRYMAPEVADGLPYNYGADVYSFGILLWELNSSKKPFEGLNRELFYERVVHGGERPALSRKWNTELTSLMTECWDADLHNRPRFRDIVNRLDALLQKEMGGATSAKKQFLPKLGGMIDRHSMWF